ncbi:unnamed protein product [Anisakis simplex]|uniref:Transmembrane protein 200B n=1 Tax=Anisakis simplex TaxID=6269 RepID=A0A158PN98_ANISI|nr:unnamed protein product [Anisakis simplex]
MMKNLFLFFEVKAEFGVDWDCQKTLWAACRAVVFGAIVIVVGMLMTVVGYFDVDLAQEEKYNEETGEKEFIVNLSKRYQLKSLQYVGPVLMGIGSFILIIACVITLESRDKHTQIIHEESKELRKKQSEALQAEQDVECVHKQLRTVTQIGSWKPAYLQLPRIDSNDSRFSLERKFSSTSCIPQLLQTADTRKLYDRLLEDYYNEIYHEIPKNDSERIDTSLPADGNRCEEEVTKQSVVAEVHVPPCNSLSSSNSANASSVSPSGCNQTAEDQHQIRTDSVSVNHIQHTMQQTHNIQSTSQQDTSTQIVNLQSGDIPFIENTSNAVTKFRSSLTVVHDQKTAPIAEIDADLHSFTSSSSPNSPQSIGSIKAVCKSLLEPKPQSCTLANGMEMR